MNFGKLFIYTAYFKSNIPPVIWKIMAESREEADIKLNDYINFCGVKGYTVPNYVEFRYEDDTPILY